MGRKLSSIYLPFLDFRNPWYILYHRARSGLRRESFQSEAYKTEHSSTFRRMRFVGGG